MFKISTSWRFHCTFPSSSSFAVKRTEEEKLLINHKHDLFIAGGWLACLPACALIRTNIIILSAPTNGIGAGEAIIRKPWTHTSSLCPSYQQRELWLLVHPSIRSQHTHSRCHQQPLPGHVLPARHSTLSPLLLIEWLAGWCSWPQKLYRVKTTAWPNV